MAKDFVKNVAYIICLSLALVFAVYIVDSVYLFPHLAKFGPDFILLVEGLVFVLIGIEASIGSGGWGALTKAAAKAATWAKLYPRHKLNGPGEVYRKDRWKPEGSTILTLVLIISGAALILMSIGHYY